MDGEESIAFLVLNHESLRQDSELTDERILATLYSAFEALVRSVSIHESHRVKSCVTHARHTLILPSGERLVAALRRLQEEQPEVARALRSAIMNSPAGFDDNGDIGHMGTSPDVALLYRGAPQPALRATWLLQGLTWSANHATWRWPQLPVRVCEADDNYRDAHVINTFDDVVGFAHREALSRHVTVLPAYEDQGQHDPRRREYDRTKSILPRHAQRILRYAIPGPDGTTWWARCGCNFYHRYMGALRGGVLWVHWNGTTNRNATRPTPEHEVPAEVKTRLAGVRTLDEADCGCREITAPGDWD